MNPLVAVLGVLLLLGSTVACSQPTDEATSTSIQSTTNRSPVGTPVPQGPTSSSASTTPEPSATTLPASQDLSILFVGNSHTSNHDIPGMVATLLESRPDARARVERLGVEFLRLANQQSSVIEAIASGDWDVVVLQGQEISQSHSIAYSTAEAVSLAELAIESGARPVFFSEWSRQGINETEYIEGIYRQIAGTAGAEVIPIGRAWDRFLADNVDYPLWAIDGNHASPDGAFLAAATIVYFLAGPDTDLTTESELTGLLATARLTIESYLNE